MTTEQELRAEIDQLKEWVNDLQSGMYINCVYCGHRYGPNTEVPASMADVLKKHIAHCPKHPMSQLKQELETLKNKPTLEEMLVELAEVNTNICLQGESSVGWTIYFPSKNKTVWSKDKDGCGYPVGFTTPLAAALAALEEKGCP